MSKKYFDTKTGSLEEKITKIATEQSSITKPKSNVKLTVEKSYFGVKPGSISDVAAKIVSEGLDPVNKDAVKKKFDDRKDKDIDNDGDVDSTDKYLHTRRSAISKNIKEMEYTSGGGMYALSAIKAKRQRIEKQIADLDRTDPKYAEKAKNLKDKIEKQKEIMQRKQKEVFDSYVPKLKEKKMKEATYGWTLVSKAKDLAKKFANNMTKAVAEIEKLEKGLSKNSTVDAELKKYNESLEEAINGESKKTFSDLRTETKVIKLGDKGKTATGKDAAAVDVEPSTKPI